MLSSHTKSWELWHVEIIPSFSRAFGAFVKPRCHIWVFYHIQRAFEGLSTTLIIFREWCLCILYPERRSLLLRYDEVYNICFTTLMIQGLRNWLTWSDFTMWVRAGCKVESAKVDWEDLYHCVNQWQIDSQVATTGGSSHAPSLWNMEVCYSFIQIQLDLLVKSDWTEEDARIHGCITWFHDKRYRAEGVYYLVVRLEWTMEWCVSLATGCNRCPTYWAVTRQSRHWVPTTYNKWHGQCGHLSDVVVKPWQGHQSWVNMCILISNQACAHSKITQPNH